MKERAGVFIPGLKGYVKAMDYADASRFVGGRADQTAYYLCGREVVIYSASKRAECMGQAPNRIVDGRVIYGAMVAMGLGEQLSSKEAQEIADCDVWQMAMYEYAV